MDSGVSQYIAIHTDLCVFDGIDDRMDVDDLVGEFQMVGNICVVKDDGTFEMDGLFEKNIVADNDGASQRAVALESDIVTDEDAVFLGGGRRLFAAVHVKFASLLDDGSHSENDTVL